MTDDSIEAKALALVNAVSAERDLPSKLQMCRLSQAQDEALCRAIEQHEAFKQEVSDVMTYIKELYPTLPRNFYRFIIPKPKPDPLVEALDSLGLRKADEWAGDIRKALAARGLEIREKGEF
jgi:hypothetical protein